MHATQGVCGCEGMPACHVSVAWLASLHLVCLELSLRALTCKNGGQGQV